MKKLFTLLMIISVVGYLLYLFIPNPDMKYFYEDDDLMF